MINALPESENDVESSAWYSGNVMSFLVNGEDTGGRFALVQANVTKGYEPPRHIHTNEDEIVYLLEGHAEFCIGEARVELSAGAAIVLPRGIEHSFILRSQHAKLLLMLTPAGCEGYLKELTQPTAHSHLAPSMSDPSIEQLVTIAARYGVEITGPP